MQGPAIETSVSLRGSGRRCRQTNANQSLPGQSHCPLPRAKTAPLFQSGGAGLLELMPASKAAFLVEVVADGKVNGELL